MTKWYDIMSLFGGHGTRNDSGGKDRTFWRQNLSPGKQGKEGGREGYDGAGVCCTLWDFFIPDIDHGGLILVVEMSEIGEIADKIWPL